jgi:hypothetical protein
VEVFPPSLVTVDSEVKGKLINISRTGLAVTMPQPLVRESTVLVEMQLSGGNGTTNFKAHVVWTTASGQAGLRLLRPGEQFRHQFETWLARPRWPAILGIGNPHGRRTTSLAHKMGRIHASRRFALVAGIMIGLVLGSGIMWIGVARTKNRVPRLQAQAQANAILAEDKPNAKVNGAVPVGNASLATKNNAGDTHPAPQDKIEEPPQSAVAATEGPPQRTTITIRLNRYVSIHPKALRNPDRIYFDLATGIRPADLPQTSLQTLNDPLVRQIRIRSKAKGQTRVVFDLKMPCQYQYRVSKLSPHELTIQLRAANSTAAKLPISRQAQPAHIASVYPGAGPRRQVHF